MTQRFIKTKPSFLEAGLPCSSLSAECQRDNNALRPPQNRLHIWWARRAPTICRASILAGLLPHDLLIPEALLPPWADEPSHGEIDNLPTALREHATFFDRLLTEIGPTQLTESHKAFLGAMGIVGDADRAFRRMSLREEYLIGSIPIRLPMNWTYRHGRAFRQTSGETLTRFLRSAVAQVVGLRPDEPVIVLDSMAGGGSIPMEALRYGLKVYANDLNPVAALILKATLEYPARFGADLLPHFTALLTNVRDKIKRRLDRFFPPEAAENWWPDVQEIAVRKFQTKNVKKIEAGIDHRIKRSVFLWMHTLPCNKCGLMIPLSTNLVLSRKGPNAGHLAIFPEVPASVNDTDCSFRIVSRRDWASCRWPRFTASDSFDPTATLTYRDGTAVCPRCGNVIDSDAVKTAAKATPGGLRSQMYAVSCRVPIKLTYRNGDVKYRYLWRFRTPTPADEEAVSAAAQELEQLRPRWHAQGLIITEEIPEGEKTREPRNMGLFRWADLFLPRQTLANTVVLEELRAAQAKARATLLPNQAEAVAVYLTLILGKVLD